MNHLILGSFASGKTLTLSQLVVADVIVFVPNENLKQNFAQVHGENIAHVLTHDALNEISRHTPSVLIDDADKLEPKL